MDSLECHRVDAVRLDTKRVEGGSGVGLVSVSVLSVELDLRPEYGTIGRDWSDED